MVIGIGCLWGGISVANEGVHLGATGYNYGVYI